MIQLFKKHKNYIFYASSIVASRGLEYFILFFSAVYLSKERYGELEFYKKLIELLAVLLAFGLPALLLTYTKSKNSKFYLTLLSLLFLILFSLIVFPVLSFFGFNYLLIPVLFHAIFFNNGIIPVFFLTSLGSRQASIYKFATSIIFYLGVFLLLKFHPSPEYAFIYINYFLIVIGILFLGFLFWNSSFSVQFFKRYFKLFICLLWSSLTLVVSNFANIMFLYTDIIIIKLISQSANSEIADYSFSLNIANMLLLIPFTLVQVDIEVIKKNIALRKKASRIFKLCLTFCLFLSLFYVLLVNTLYLDFSQTVIVFMVILFAKFFQDQSVLHGALLLVQKQFSINLKINLIILFLNIGLSYIFYLLLGIIGIALASLLSLSIRFFLLKNFSNLNKYD